MKKKLRLSATPVGVRNGLHGAAASSAGGPGGICVSSINRPRIQASLPTSQPALLRSSIGWIGLVGISILFFWSYWPTLAGLWNTWRHNEDYSGGMVVPLIAAYLIWSRRRHLQSIPVGICWWGLAVLVAAQVLRFGGLLYAYSSLEHASLYLSFIGLVLLLFGPAFVRELKWIIIFIGLAFPPPQRIHEQLALPLQSLATTSAHYGLELLGVLVAREGNVLRLGEQTSIAVAEACSGLRMLTAFVIVSATLTFVVRRPVWQKIVLVLFSVPIAIFSNTLRLIVTALLYRSVDSAAAETFFHDFAGITMVPVAVAASLGLLTLLKWLTAPPAPTKARA